MFCDEMSLLKSMVSNAIKNNMLFICVSTKDDGYKFFNINDSQDMVNFAAHMTYVQLSTEIAMHDSWYKYND